MMKNDIIVTVNFMEKNIIITKKHIIVIIPILFIITFIFFYNRPLIKRTVYICKYTASRKIESVYFNLLAIESETDSPLYIF
jgi:hypothetical protein